MFEGIATSFLFGGLALWAAVIAGRRNLTNVAGALTSAKAHLVCMSLRLEGHFVFNVAPVVLSDEGLFLFCWDWLLPMVIVACISYVNGHAMDFIPCGRKPKLVHSGNRFYPRNGVLP